MGLIYNSLIFLVMLFLIWYVNCIVCYVYNIHIWIELPFNFQEERWRLYIIVGARDDINLYTCVVKCSVKRRKIQC
jgi:hypothetical protein